MGGVGSPQAHGTHAMSWNTTRTATHTAKHTATHTSTWNTCDGTHAMELNDT